MKEKGRHNLKGQLTGAILPEKKYGKSG